jgi:8-oxo-dGTP pyrophosphatase MutT (NUDIX family)
MSETVGEELVEVVDRAGNVLDVVTRSRMRAERLRHRCTYVAVVEGPADRGFGDGLDLATPLVVHRRADWKDTYPSFWDVAFGGVCGAGERWEASARRELVEEAGIEGSMLHDLGPTSYEADDNKVVGRLFITSWPSQPDCLDGELDGEVVAVDHVPIGELESWTRTVSVCPDSLAVVVPALIELATGPRWDRSADRVPDHR